MAFAEPADLNAYTGETWDENQAVQVLDAATAAIQKVTGQTLSHVVGDVVVLTPSPDGSVIVPELPVLNVSALEILVPTIPSGVTGWTTLDPTGYRWNSRGMVYVTVPTWNWPNQWDTVRVTYDHGYQAIPNPIVNVCLAVAARMIDNPYSYNSTNVGGVSVGMGGGGAGVTLRDTELAILDRYTVLEVA